MSEHTLTVEAEGAVDLLAVLERLDIDSTDIESVEASIVVRGAELPGDMTIEADPTEIVESDPQRPQRTADGGAVPDPGEQDRGGVATVLPEEGDEATVDNLPGDGGTLTWDSLPEKWVGDGSLATPDGIPADRVGVGDPEPFGYLHNWVCQFCGAKFGGVRDRRRHEAVCGYDPEHDGKVAGCQCGRVYTEPDSWRGHQNFCPAKDGRTGPSDLPDGSLGAFREGHVQEPTVRESLERDTIKHIALTSLAWSIEDSDEEWRSSPEVHSEPWTPDAPKVRTSKSLSDLFHEHGAIRRKKGFRDGNVQWTYQLTEWGRSEADRLGEWGDVDV